MISYKCPCSQGSPFKAISRAAREEKHFLNCTDANVNTLLLSHLSAAMLRSTARRLTAAKLDPLTRAQMDMFSAHVLSDSSPSSLSSFSPLEKSNAAKTGETMRGDVVLPVELKQAVKSAISGETAKHSK